MSDVEPAPNSYHHGDLRRALLEAASAILAETGRWDFSLREVARRAGVSHNAPYRHFPDKDALLAALAVIGFAALRVETAGAAAGLADPAATLRALGQAYIRFGLANPALYRLMFGHGLPSTAGLTPALRDAIETARRGLRDVIVWGARTQVFTVDGEDAEDVTAAVVASWSLVHGFTFLAIDRVIEREVGPGTPADWVTRSVDRFMSGMIRGEP